MAAPNLHKPARLYICSCRVIFW